MGAPSNGSKTAHSKVANGTNAGTSGNTTATNQTTTTSKRSSSSADGDYQLVQHEVLYSQSSQYEVSLRFTILLIMQEESQIVRVNFDFCFSFDGNLWSHCQPQSKATSRRSTQFMSKIVPMKWNYISNSKNLKRLHRRFLSISTWFKCLSLRHSHVNPQEASWADFLFISFPNIEYWMRELTKKQIFLLQCVNTS